MWSVGIYPYRASLFWSTISGMNVKRASMMLIMLRGPIMISLRQVAKTLVNGRQWFHTPFLMPCTLVTEYFDWLVQEVMTCICHKLRICILSAKQFHGEISVTLLTDSISMSECVLKTLPNFGRLKRLHDPFSCCHVKIESAERIKSLLKGQQVVNSNALNQNNCQIWA